MLGGEQESETAVKYRESDYKPRLHAIAALWDIEVICGMINIFQYNEVSELRNRRRSQDKKLTSNQTYE